MRYVAEGVEGAGGDVLELRPDLAALGPFAVLAEGDGADHGGEGMAAHVFRKLGVIETLGALDRLGQHLTCGIAIGRERPAERVETLCRRLLSIFVEQLLGA